MAASDARPVPIKNTAFRAVFPILDADGDLVTGAASLDSEVSKDQGTFADCTNEATEIATSSGIYYLDLTSTEMNADCVAVIVKTGTAGAKTTVLVFYPEETGDINVDVTAFGGTAGTFSGGRPETNASHLAGTALTGRDIGASVLLSSGTGTGQLDFTSGVVKSNLTQVSGTSVTATGGRQEVNTSHIGGSAIAQAAGIAQVNVTQVGGSATPVTNLTTVFSTDFAANYNTTLDQWNVNIESWNATAVPAEHTAGYPIVTIKDGTGTGEIDTSSGRVLLANGSHGGVAATLTLLSLNIDNTGAGPAISLASADSESIRMFSTTGDCVTITSNGGNGDAIQLVPHGTGVGIRGSITGAIVGSITGSLSGSVGSIGAGGIVAATFGAGAIDAAAIANGAIDGATFASGALDGVWSVTTRTLTAGTNIILAKGVGITGFNDLSAAQVNTEVDTALSDINLDHLVKIAVDTDFPTTVHLDSVLGYLADNGTTATFARSTDSLEAIRDRGDIAWITGGGSGGSGAFAITVTVNDGAVALQNVSVAIYDAGVSVASGTTDAAGQVTFSLNAGTYTVALTKGGYSFTPVTRTVTGNQAGTLVNALSMTVNAGITPPADPSRCVVAGYLKDLNGNALVGAVLKVRLVPALANRPITASGNVVTFVSDEAISDAAGLVSIELIRTDVMTPSGCTYTFTCTDAGLDERNVVLAQATLDLANL